MQPREELQRPQWRTGNHRRTLLERNLQEVWVSRGSSNEGLESRPIFLPSAGVAHTCDGIPQLCGTWALGTSMESLLWIVKGLHAHCSNHSLRFLPLDLTSYTRSAVTHLHHQRTPSPFYTLTGKPIVLIYSHLAHVPPKLEMQGFWMGGWRHDLKNKKEGLSEINRTIDAPGWRNDGSSHCFL